MSVHLPTAPADLAGLRLIVWGIGRHGGGEAALRLALQNGAEVWCCDSQGPQAFAHWQHLPWIAQDELSHCNADLIVCSPAIPPRVIPPALSDRLTSPEGLFLHWHRGTRIAVTGSKGKSTVAALTAHLLEWPVVGNSQRPCLDWWLDTPDAARHPLVVECSSFQLERLALQAPRFTTALFTAIDCDHLDWHPDLAHYRRAKARLADWSTCNWGFAQAVLPGLAEPPVRVEGDAFRDRESGIVAPLTALQLPGAHNRANARLALSACLHHGGDPQRLQDFTGLPHRLQVVHQTPGRTWIDDSAATNPDATIAAITAIDGPLILICGGADKGHDFGELTRALQQRGPLRVLTVGVLGPALAECFQRAGITATCCEHLAAAVDAAACKEGDATVLLSPGCASFDQFDGYVQRGERFQLLVSGAT